MFKELSIKQDMLVEWLKILMALFIMNITMKLILYLTKDKDGNVIETKVTTYQYNDDSTTPSFKHTVTEDQDGIIKKSETESYCNGHIWFNDIEKYENGQLISKLATYYREDGSVNRINEYKIENGKPVGSTETDYRENGTIKCVAKWVHYDLPGGYGSRVGFCTYYNEDGTISYTEDLVFALDETTGCYESTGVVITKYREDGTVESTSNYKIFWNDDYSIGIFKPTEEAFYNPDGTIEKEAKYEYDDKGHLTKTTTIRYEYDDKGRVTKKTTSTEDPATGKRTESVEEFTFYDDEDVNGDGKVDIADYVAILNAMGSEQNEPEFDLNGNGKVDIFDALSVLNAMANW